MTKPVLDDSVVRSATRRRLPLEAWAVVWLVLYQVSPPWWDWIIYDVAGLDEATRFLATSRAGDTTSAHRRRSDANWPIGS